jgi:hypothetical protein
MRRTIQVYLGSEPRRLGTIRYDQQGARESAAFEYDADWLTASDRFTIDPALQLVAGPQFHKKARDGSIVHDVLHLHVISGMARISAKPSLRRFAESLRATVADWSIDIELFDIRSAHFGPQCGRPFGSSDRLPRRARHFVRVT